MRSPSMRLRRWLVGIAIACIVLELLYLVAAHFMLKGDTLTRLINKKPEKMQITWTSARSWFPGVVTVEKLAIRGQTRRIQWYLTADDAHWRISLVRLALKQVHIRSVDSSGLDFRLRRRLDLPAKVGEEGPPREIRGSENFPEIPGFTNPPDPTPEDLYPPKKKLKKPWTINLGGVDVDGPIRVAVGRMRLEGEGVTSGAMTYRTRDFVEVRRGNLRLTGGRLIIDSELASDDLTLDVRSRWRAFPAKGAKLPQILEGVSGSFAIAGNILAGASVPIELVPGLPISATGRLDTTLFLKDGTLQPDSSYSFTSDGLRVGLLGLTAVGPAKVAGTTRAGDSGPRTEVTIDLDSFEFLNPEDASVGIQGSGLAVRAAWDGQSLAHWKPATSVEVELPSATISDVGVVGRLLPVNLGLAVTSGTGTLSARLAVDADRQASGQMDLTTQQLRLEARGVPIRANLGIRTTLTRGDLQERRFEIAEATITVDNAMNEALERKEQKKRGPWWCSLKLTQGTLAFGRPMTGSGTMTVKMHDIRPVVAVINEFSDPPKWISLLPDVKNIDGSMIVDADGTTILVKDADITGESLQMLGSLRLAEKKANGRIYVKYKGVAAGIGLDHGKSSLHLVKPREWFDEQGASSY